MFWDGETYDAWRRYFQTTLEIGLCMREQDFFSANMTYKKLDEVFAFQDKVVSSCLTKQGV